MTSKTSNTSNNEVSPMERTCCLRPFPNGDSRCAVTWYFTGLIKSGCQSKPNFKDMCSLMNNHQQENVGSHQKKMPRIEGQRRSTNKMVGVAKLRLESNPIPVRDA